MSRVHTREHNVLKAQYFHIAFLVLSLPIGVWIFCSRSGDLALTIVGYVWLTVLVIDLIVYIVHMFRPFLELQHAIDSLEASVDLPEGDTPHRSITAVFQQLLHRQATVEIMKREAEINALQSQINPHFLYNTLETIRGQALCAGATEVASTTKALADIFRYSISKKGTMIHLEEELANIDSYMQIQQIRFSNKFELRKEIDEDVRNIKIPKLVIQPVIENALKYGLEVKREKGYVLIRAFRTDTELVIVVQDDGVGMPTEKLRAINRNLSANNDVMLSEKQASSIGLTNIHNRIRLIYGNHYGVTITSAADIGTTVTLHLGVIY